MKNNVNHKCLHRCFCKSPFSFKELFNSIPGVVLGFFSSLSPILSYFSFFSWLIITIFLLELVVTKNSHSRNYWWKAWKNLSYLIRNINTSQTPNIFSLEILSRESVRRWVIFLFSGQVRLFGQIFCVISWFQRVRSTSWGSRPCNSTPCCSWHDPWGRGEKSRS